MASSHHYPDSERTKRVLALVDELLGHQGTRIAAIDAEFYWRCCRLDFVEAIEPLRKQYRRKVADLRAASGRAILLQNLAIGNPSPLSNPQCSKPISYNWSDGSVPSQIIIDLFEHHRRVLDVISADGPLEISPELHVAFDAYSHGLRLYTDLLRATNALFDFQPEDFDVDAADVLSPFAREVLSVSRAFGLPYGTVLLHITRGSPISPLVECRVDSTRQENPEYDLAQLDVYSAEINGYSASQIMDAYCSISVSALPKPPENTEVSIAIRLQRMSDLVSGLPFVRMTVGIPLPPLTVIAQTYDAVASEQRRWTEQLIGSPNAQHPDVVLRTWAVGLLVGAGWDTNEAIRTVTERAGWDRYVSQERFNQDRRLVVERVPDARAYLYRRGT